MSKSINIEMYPDKAQLLYDLLEFLEDYPGGFAGAEGTVTLDGDKVIRVQWEKHSGLKIKLFQRLFPTDVYPV